MKDIRVAIVASGRGLAQARVLSRSISRVRPAWPITTLVLPAEYPLALEAAEPFEPLFVENLGDPALVRRVNATPYAFQSAVAGPALVETLLQRGAEAVLFIAPDSLFFSDPVELEELLSAHDAVVVPRLSGDLPEDGERPDSRDLREAGELDDGLFAIRATEGGSRVAQWWAEQAARQATQADRGEGEEQLSSVRALADVAVLTHPGYSVSAWNLHERALQRAEDGTLIAAGEPVRVLRLPGFRIDRPFWLAELSTRTVALGDPILEPLCERYAEEVKAAGWILDEEPGTDETGTPEPQWLGNGLRYDPRVKRLHHAAEVVGEEFGDLSTRDGAEALARWLLEPGRFGAAHGINRYAYDVWQARPDVTRAYGDLDDAEVAAGFIGWLWVYGREELELQDRLLPPRPDWVPRTAADAPRVLVTGYLRGVVGLGAAARGYVEALEAAGIPLVTHVLPTDPPETVTTTTRLRTDEVPFRDRSLPDGEQADIHLFCINADQTETALAQVPADSRPSYTIGLWAWETDIIPKRWERVFPYVDEIWTYTSWIADNIAPYSPVPVTALPIPVRAPQADGLRVPFELPADRFRFLFNFDFYSTTTRKNPVGLIKAFTSAFSEDEGPVLVLKTINGKLKPADRALVQKAAAGRRDVLIIDGVISEQELAALFQACDCYVSLHRAEGFGMTLAEAMALGKPVITTGWSGNMDFTTAENSYLVDYELRKVGPDNPPYDPNGTWAEPSIEHAAKLMREVWENREEAHRRGRRGQEDVLALLSAQAIGGRARDRLQRIASLTRTLESGRQEPKIDFSGLTAQLEAQVWPARWLGHKGGAVGKAQKGIVKALRPVRPYLAGSGSLDDTLVRTIEQLAAEVERLRSEQAEDRARIRHLEYRLNRRV